MCIRDRLKANGYEVLVAYSAAEGLRSTLTHKPEVIVLDVSMETDTAGFEFIYQIRSCLLYTSRCV